MGSSSVVPTGHRHRGNVCSCLNVDAGGRSSVHNGESPRQRLITNTTSFPRSSPTSQHFRTSMLFRPYTSLHSSPRTEKDLICEYEPPAQQWHDYANRARTSPPYSCHRAQNRRRDQVPGRTLALSTSIHQMKRTQCLYRSHQRRRSRCADPRLP